MGFQAKLSSGKSCINFTVAENVSLIACVPACLCTCMRGVRAYVCLRVRLCAHVRAYICDFVFKNGKCICVQDFELCHWPYSYMSTI